MQGVDEPDVYTGFNEQELFAPEQHAPVSPTGKDGEKRPPTKVNSSKIVGRNNVPYGNTNRLTNATGCEVLYPNENVRRAGGSRL